MLDNSYLGQRVSCVQQEPIKAQLHLLDLLVLPALVESLQLTQLQEVFPSLLVLFVRQAMQAQFNALLLMPTQPYAQVQI